MAHNQEWRGGGRGARKTSVMVHMQTNVSSGIYASWQTNSSLMGDKRSFIPVRRAASQLLALEIQGTSWGIALCPGFSAMRWLGASHVDVVHQAYRWCLPSRERAQSNQKAASFVFSRFLPNFVWCVEVCVLLCFAFLSWKVYFARVHSCPILYYYFNSCFRLDSVLVHVSIVTIALRL